MERYLGGGARTACNTLEKTPDIDGIIVRNPSIEAIFVGFVGFFCINRFETSERPTLHIELPTVYGVRQKLDDVSNGR